MMQGRGQMGRAFGLIGRGSSGDTTPGGVSSAPLLEGDMADDASDGLLLEGDMADDASDFLLLEGDMA